MHKVDVVIVNVVAVEGLLYFINKTTTYNTYINRFSFALLQSTQ